MSTTITFLVTVISRYGGSFTGRIDAPMNNGDFGPLLEAVYAAGGNHPDPAVTFPGWAQPSVTPGDRVYVWAVGEGPCAITAWDCLPVGWGHREVTPGEQAAVTDFFCDDDPEYAAAHAAMVERREAARARWLARRAIHGTVVV